MPLTLADIADLAAQIPAPDLVGEARELADRYAARELCVACLGQFKRGKSTLINALLGEPLMPVGTLPVTAIPVLVRYGPHAFRVRRGAEWFERPLTQLPDLVADTGNAAARDGVRAVEVRTIAPILAHGVALLDTPGMGSIVTGHDAGTRDMLPRIDAALLVIGADPPVSRVEIDLIDQLDRGVTPIWLVLTKADRVSASESTSALAYARTVIAEHTGRSIADVFVVSAAEALAGRPSAEWHRLLAAFETLANRNEELLARRATHAVARLGSLLHQRIANVIDLLTEPAKAAARQADQLAVLQQKAERALALAAAHLGADVGMMVGGLRDQRTTFLAENRTPVTNRTSLAFDRDWQNGTIRTSNDVLALAAREAQNTLALWETTVRASVPQQTRTIVDQATDQIEALRGDLAGASGVALDVGPRDEIEDASAFERYYFRDLAEEFAAQHRYAAWALALLPAPLRRSRLRRIAAQHALDLVDRNTSVITADIDMWTQDTRRKVERWVKEMLSRISATAAEEAAAAATVRAAGEDAVSTRVEALRAIDERLSSA